MSAGENASAELHAALLFACPCSFHRDLHKQKRQCLSHKDLELGAKGWPLTSLPSSEVLENVGQGSGEGTGEQVKAPKAVDPLSLGIDQCCLLVRG